MLVFPLFGYRAPRLYAIYLFAIYAALLVASCLVELHPHIGEALLCTPATTWLFNVCDRPKPDHCS